MDLTLIGLRSRTILFPGSSAEYPALPVKLTLTLARLPRVRVQGHCGRKPQAGRFAVALSILKRLSPRRPRASERCPSGTIEPASAAIGPRPPRNRLRAWFRMEFQRLLVGLVDFCRRHAVLVFAAAARSRCLPAFLPPAISASAPTPTRCSRQACPGGSGRWRSRLSFRNSPMSWRSSSTPRSQKKLRRPRPGWRRRSPRTTRISASVSRPDASPFLKKEGLLFLDPKQLEGLLERTIDAQPFLGQLAKDPSARGLFACARADGQGIAAGPGRSDPLSQRARRGSTRRWPPHSPVIRSPCRGRG